MSQVTIVGRLTDDPQLRYVPSGMPLVNFTIAVSRTEYREGALQHVNDGLFRCVGRRRLAENTAKALKKGTRVIVVGELVQREFEDRDGNKRSSVSIQISHAGPDLELLPIEAGPSVAAPDDDNPT